MTAPIGPRLDPFPWEERFYEYTPETMALFDNPANDAVQCHVRITGAGWEYAGPGTGSMFGPGINTVGARWGTSYTIPTKSEGETPGVLDYLDAWAYTNSFENPIVKAAHETDDQWYWDWPDGPIIGATPIAGERVYPGVFTTNPWSGLGFVEAIWLNQPISYEAWFATNENRSNPLMGFDGYTMFGDQQNAGPACMDYDSSALADLYRRRYVCGVLKRTADLATCGPTDVMLGVIVTSDGTTTTVQLCLNGAIAHVETTPTRFGSTGSGQSSWAIGDTWWEAAWEGYASEIGVWPGFVDTFEVGVSPALGWFTISQWLEPDDPNYIPSFGYDTYDVKWAWYVDDYSPTHPVGTPFEFTIYSGFMAYWASPPNMYTGLPQLLPPQSQLVPDFWTCAVDASESDATIVSTVIPGNFVQNAMALGPVLYWDFEGPETLPAQDAPFTMAVEEIETISNFWWTWDDPNSYLAPGPIGQAYYDSNGGWWGAETRVSPDVLATIVQNGFTIVKVLNHTSETGGYCEFSMDVFTDNYTTPPDEDTNTYFAKIMVDCYYYDADTTSQADFLARVIWFASPAQSYRGMSDDFVSGFPTPFFEDREFHVYAVSAEFIDATTVQIRTYVDGAMIRESNLAVPANMIFIPYGTSSPRYNIYASSDSGAIDDQVFYDRVLTPEEIATLVL